MWGWTTFRADCRSLQAFVEANSMHSDEPGLQEGQRLKHTPEVDVPGDANAVKDLLKEANKMLKSLTRDEGDRSLRMETIRGVRCFKGCRSRSTSSSRRP